MERAERLLALVAELRAAVPVPPGRPAPLPARLLADRLGVGERTVRRDLAALTRSGLAVHASRAGFTLPRSDHRAAPPGLDGTDPLACLALPVAEILTRAVRTRRVVRISYTDQAGQRTRRDVEAQGLVVTPYGDYLVGWCRLRDAPRMFRLDRIGAALLTEGDAALRDLAELLAVLRVPAPRPPTTGDAASAPARARAWTLDRIRQVRLRLTDTIADAQSAGEGTAGLRTVLGHLAEWARWQTAAVRAVATGGDLVFDGRRPAFPTAFDGALSYLAREQMIQDVMAVRSFGELARDLDAVLDGAAHWVAGCDDPLWLGTLPDPGESGRLRPLADLLAGWHGPLAHIEWHLDRFAAGGPRRPGRSTGELELVEHCPLRA